MYTGWEGGWLALFKIAHTTIWRGVFSRCVCFWLAPNFSRIFIQLETTITFNMRYTDFLEFFSLSVSDELSRCFSWCNQTRCASIPIDVWQNLELYYSQFFSFNGMYSFFSRFDSSYRINVYKCVVYDFGLFSDYRFWHAAFTSITEYSMRPFADYIIRFLGRHYTMRVRYRVPRQGRFIRR